MSKIEHAHHLFRSKDFSQAEIKATSRFSADEVRSILDRTHTVDVRQIGCPDELFERILNLNAEKRGIKPKPVADDTLDRRITEASIF